MPTSQEESSRQHHSRSQRSSGHYSFDQCPIDIDRLLMVIIWILLAISWVSWHSIYERQFSQVKKLEDEMVAVAQQAEARFWEHGSVPCKVFDKWLDLSQNRMCNAYIPNLDQLSIDKWVYIGVCSQFMHPPTLLWLQLRWLSLLLWLVVWGRRRRWLLFRPCGAFVTRHSATAASDCGTLEGRVSAQTTLLCRMDVDANFKTCNSLQSIEFQRYS